jgi:hypothetical protein
MHLLSEQLSILAGVVVGALASYLTTAATERARWQRTLNSRWDDRRVEAYATDARAVKKMINISMRVAAARGMGGAGEPLAPTPENLDLLAAAEAERGDAWETVLLLGRPETVAAARDWHNQVWRLEWYARGLIKGEASDWDHAMTTASEARSVFYSRARNDLGVAGGNLPEGAEPFDASKMQ